MKYVTKIPGEDKKLSEKLVLEEWKKIKEPSSLISAILFSFPVMLITTSLVFLYLHIIEGNITRDIGEMFLSGSFSFEIRFDYIIFLYLFVILHEIIHLVFIPGFLSSDKTFFGLRPWGGFVFTTEKTGKKRFILISLAPFVLLSVVLPGVLLISGITGTFLTFLFLVNAAASSVDVLNAVIVGVQVPGNSVILNNGFKTFHKSRNTEEI